MNTEFGNAWVNNMGYYVIVSSGENYNKLLHRLIYEKFHKITLLSSAIIHHIDGNKLNNSIENLEMISKSEHNKIHHKNKVNSRETINKMRKSKTGKNNPMFGTGTSGYYRVYKSKKNECKQGFTWVYEYVDNGKKKCISRVDIAKLEEIVKSKKLPWFKINEVL